MCRWRGHGHLCCQVQNRGQSEPRQHRGWRQSGTSRRSVAHNLHMYIHTYLLDGQGSLCLPTKLYFIQANLSELRSCVKDEVNVLGLPIPNSPYGFCGHKATLNKGNPTRRMAGSSTSSGFERWTRDQKVVSLSPCRSSGRIVFPGVNTLC